MPATFDALVLALPADWPAAAWQTRSRIDPMDCELL